MPIVVMMLRSSRTRLAALIAALSFVGAVPVGATVAHDGPRVVAAKSCSSGYTHAVINGSHKCLRRGQYCARSADRQYHRYGYHCHRRDSRGSYHLS
jgi:hypothetical protein